MKRSTLFFAVFASVFFCALNVQAQPGYINTVAGNGTAGFSGDGGAATAAQLNHNSCIWVDNFGNLYIAEVNNNRIRKVNTSGVITTIAGTGSAGYSGDGGPATSAQLSYTQGVAVDNAGNIYIADQHNNRIRKVGVSGIITTFAGNGSGGYSGDGGPASAALINQPAAVTVDNLNNVYICDQNNARIRKVDNLGIITTVAGGGSSGLGDGGPATSAQLNWPCNVSVDNVGNIFIADFQDNRIRKVNPSGIISTVVGTGVAGYSGDGGPATAAQICNHWGSVYPDNYGNIYIADLYNNCIRKVNNLGIITTISGNGTAGYSGNGGPASSALLNQPIFVFATYSGDLLVSDCGNSVIRKINGAPTYIADSFSIFVNGLCNGPQLTIVVNNFSSNYNVITYFGDGTSNSSPILGGYSGVSGYATFSHNYNASGTYTLKTLLMNGTIVLDSLIYSYEYKLCNTIPVKFYYDTNGNCSKDTPEFYLSQAATTEVDSNSVPVDTISSTSGFYYTAYGNPGDVYTFKVLSLPIGLTATCPVSGIVSDTLQSITYNTATKFIGLQCTNSNSFDLAESALIPVTGIHDEWGDIYVQNTSCLPTNATLTLHYSPKYAGTPSQIYPAATSVTNNSIVWNFNSLTSAASNPIQLHYAIWSGSTDLTIGDTVNSYLEITPTASDIDPLNNSEIIIDTVRGGCDPNEMTVKPSGYISAGTQLQYTINFENTGNDTAFNIYVMDTLSDNVDAHSLRLVMASNTMNIAQFTANGHNIVKFDFPGIDLLDSTHSVLCNGAVIFNINAKAGLANGTTILNHAGVYFDDNPVVTTDTVEDIIGWPASVPNVSNKSKVEVYPNPANDILTIKIDNGQFNAFTITNSIGDVVIKDALSNVQTNVNVKTLSAGLYYITLKGDSGVVVRKFVKL